MNTDVNNLYLVSLRNYYVSFSFVQRFRCTQVGHIYFIFYVSLKKFLQSVVLLHGYAARCVGVGVYVYIVFIDIVLIAIFSTYSISSRISTSSSSSTASASLWSNRNKKICWIDKYSKQIYYTCHLTR